MEETGTKEIIESYQGKDEYEYVKTLCDQLEQQFPGILVTYRHLPTLKYHEWALEYPLWRYRCLTPIWEEVESQLKVIYDDSDNLHITKPVYQAIIIHHYYET